MIRSLLRYTEHLSRILLKKERDIVFEDIRRYLASREWQTYSSGNIKPDRHRPLQEAIEWLLTAQKATIDKGFGSFHLAGGWSASYPETTGYIIPTLTHYGKKYNHSESVESALKAADFLVAIQKGTGGWQGGRIGENRPEIVFNTGQVIRGMLAAYELTGENIYLDAAIRAGAWLSKVQHPEGYWKTHALMEQERVYDTFVDVPLLMLARVTGDDAFRSAAIRNLDWVIGVKMLLNGWFEDCDNTVKRNHKPILHTVAYTLEGLIDAGILLNDHKYIDAAALGASKLRDLFSTHLILNGRYDTNWTGTEHLICTGGAQMASVWLKLDGVYKERQCRLAAENMINLLIYIQQRKSHQKPSTLGALPGSFPVWGRYEPFAFPNWATKFFCDAIMLEEDLGS